MVNIVETIYYGSLGDVMKLVPIVLIFITLLMFGVVFVSQYATHENAPKLNSTNTTIEDMTASGTTTVSSLFGFILLGMIVLIIMAILITIKEALT